MTKILLDIPDEIIQKINFIIDTEQTDYSLENFLIEYITENWKDEVHEFDFSEYGVSKAPLTKFEMFRYKFEMLGSYGSKDYNINEVEADLLNCRHSYIRTNWNTASTWVSWMSPEFISKYKLDVSKDMFQITEEMYTSGDLKKEFPMLNKTLSDFIFS